MKQCTKQQAITHFLNFGQYEHRIHKFENLKKIFEIFYAYHEMTDIEKKHHEERIDLLFKNKI